MNAPTASQRRLVIVGATGMVGGYALRYALENSAVGSVTLIARRKVGMSHPKLTEVFHRDFADCSALAARPRSAPGCPSAPRSFHLQIGKYRSPPWGRRCCIRYAQRQNRHPGKRALY